MAADVVAGGFTQISNEVFRDARLSGLAMGVFGHISTHRDGYGITPESISRSMRNGVSAIKGALRELEKYGYLNRTRVRREDGTLGPSVYEITDMPDGLAIIEAAPYPRSPRSEPAVGNQPQAPTCDDASSPRSEPAVEKPPVEKPPVVNRSTKNISHKNISEKTSSSLSRPEQVVLAAGATEDEMTRVLQVIKDTHRPRSLAAYVAKMAETGDLTALLAEIRGLRQPSRPDWCGSCDQLTRRLMDDEGADLGPCSSCHPRAVNGDLR
jgi:hypothetical protein